MQAKESDQRKNDWQLSVSTSVRSEKKGRKSKSVTTQYGSWDFLYVGLGADQFALIPKEVLRRHGVFLGQESVKKPQAQQMSKEVQVKKSGRKNLLLCTSDFHPNRGVAPFWQKMCARHILSWNSKTIKRDVESILNQSF